MLEKEKELINETLINDSMCYNMTLGGIGSWSHIDSSGENNCMKRQDVAARVSESLKKRIQSDSNLKKTIVENAKKASIAAAKKRKGSCDSEETKQKRVETRIKTLRSQAPKYKLTSPAGKVYEFSTLSEPIKTFGLNRNVLAKHINNGVINKSPNATRISPSAEKTYGWSIESL